MQTYRIGGVTLQSELALPELGIPGAAAAPDWTFSLSARRPRPPHGAWFHHWTAGDGRRWLSFGRDRDAYVLRFARATTFRLTPACRTIVCEGARRVPTRRIRHLFLHQVLPLALARSSRFVLHASGVIDGSSGIGFAGHTGSGKSTLCAALVGEGRQVLCDDVLVAEITDDGVIGVPTCRSVRLWPDSIGAVFGFTSNVRKSEARHLTKRFVAASDAASCLPHPTPLRLLCVLGTRDAMRSARRVELRRVSRRDAVIRLTSFGFQLDVQDPEGLRAEFERLSAFVERVPVIELVYPWRLAGVREVARDVLDALRCVP